MTFFFLLFSVWLSLIFFNFRERVACYELPTEWNYFPWRCQLAGQEKGDTQAETTEKEEEEEEETGQTSAKDEENKKDENETEEEEINTFEHIEEVKEDYIQTPMGKELRSKNPHHFITPLSPLYHPFITPNSPLS